MNLAIKLTALTSLILTSPRILQCLCSANSSKKKKKKKDTPARMPLPQGLGVLHIGHPHFRTKETFSTYLVFSLLLCYRS